MTDRNHDADHGPHVRRALALAREAAANGNTPFGSLLVLDGETIAESENTTRVDEDITAHPELKLARWAARELDGDEVSDVTMYTSTEPCPMCAGAISLSGLGRVVYSVDGETAAELGPNDGPALSSKLLERVGEIEVVGPVLEAEGRAVHREHWSGQTTAGAELPDTTDDRADRSGDSTIREPDRSESQSSPENSR